jgi:hypothetical protein
MKDQYDITKLLIDSKKHFDVKIGDRVFYNTQNFANEEIQNIFYENVDEKVWNIIRFGIRVTLYRELCNKIEN